MDGLPTNRKVFNARLSNPGRSSPLTQIEWRGRRLYIVIPTRWTTIMVISLRANLFAQSASPRASE